MKKSKYTWRLQEKIDLPDEFMSLLASNNISSLLGQILWHRGIQTQESLETFLHPKVENLYDPFLIYEMDKAIERIQLAIEQGEKILVYGDYDADGITSTTVMKEAIELIGGEVDYFLPNRFIHGYGPNKMIFEEKIQSGTQLIITVDNGVAGHEALQYAFDEGVDVIVTDHHELPTELPKAYAIVHPKHPKGAYPFGDLAGVGVAFKVATALLGELPVEFLDLVSIGTIADLVSLTDENRILVKMGLDVIRTGERIGLDSLIQLADLNKECVNEESIGFTIAPRLNALGRLGDASPGVELLTTFDEEEAQAIAERINQQNEQRKEIVKQITEEAFQMLCSDDEVHILSKEGWHEGVLGIVAGRIMQETGKPTIVLTIDSKKQTAKGSGRSVSALNLYECLAEVRELFIHFGGHHMAAGMTVPVENIEKVKKHVNNYITQNEIDLTQGQEMIIDETIKVDEATLSFIQQLKVLAPFGTDNMIPTFLFEKVNAKQVKQIGGDKTHLKFQLEQSGALLDGIAFQMGHQADELRHGGIDVSGQLGINEWNGNKKPQLIVKDFSIEGKQFFDLRGKANLQKQIPTEGSMYIYFSKENKAILKDNKSDYLLFNSLEETLNEIQSKQTQQLVFVDCPDDQQIIREIVLAGDIQRVYLMGISQEEAFLTGVGTREQFARLYKFVMEQKQVDVRYKLGDISKYLQIQEKLLIFMIKVFSDLGFVTIENGVLTKVETPANRPLTDSKMYQLRLKKIKTEEFLLYSDRDVLAQWLWNKEENNKWI